MKWTYHDGGRKDAGFKGETGDCGVRAVAIALRIPYSIVYDAANAMGKMERRRTKKSSARNGIWTKTLNEMVAPHGWVWVPTMGIGTGCKVHLRASELPSGRLIVRVSGHYVAVIDGVIYDTSDCSRGGTRCVYGYWHNPLDTSGKV